MTVFRLTDDHRLVLEASLVLDGDGQLMRRDVGASTNSLFRGAAFASDGLLLVAADRTLLLATVDGGSSSLVHEFGERVDCVAATNDGVWCCAGDGCFADTPDGGGHPGAPTRFCLRESSDGSQRRRGYDVDIQ